MRLLFITIGEITNLDENSMYPDLLRYFRDQGHEVHILCQRERRYGLPTDMNLEHGMKVLRVKTGNITKTNLLEKGISTLLIGHQFKRALNKFLRGIHYDLILYSTPPITIANTIHYLKKRNPSFTYLMLKDIFPQNAVDIGLLTTTGWKGLIVKYFLIKEKKLYRISDTIGCMSDANVDFLRSKHPYLGEKRIEVCPNTINPLRITESDRAGLREQFQLPKDKIIFLCGGNFGKPQDVDFILRILKSNEEARDRHFVICGSGTDFYKLKEYSSMENASHVTVIDAITKEEYNRLLDSCDIGLLFLDHRFTIPNFPSRLLDYMNHGMPVLAATDKNSDVGEVITRNGFGWWCESQDEMQYNNILNLICSNPDELEQMRENSRLTLIHNYDTKVAYEKIINSYHLGGEV